MGEMPDAALNSNHDAVEIVQRADAVPSAEYLNQLISGLMQFQKGRSTKAEVRGVIYDHVERGYHPTVLALKSDSLQAEVIVGNLGGEQILKYTGLGVEAFLWDSDRRPGADSLAFLMVKPHVWKAYLDSARITAARDSMEDDLADTVCGHPFDDSQLISGTVALNILPPHLKLQLQDLFDNYQRFGTRFYNQRFDEKVERKRK